MEKEIITVGDVAALLRLSKTRVRQKAASGELPGKKIPGGRDWFFNKKESESSAEQIERIATVLVRVFIRQAELQLRKGV